MNMNSSESKTLLALANIKNESDEFAHLDEGAYGDDLATELAELRKEEKRRTVRAAAEVIVTLDRLSNERIEKLRETLRETRKAEATLIASIEALAVAKAYAKETNNFLPVRFVVDAICPCAVIGAGQSHLIPEADYKRLLGVVRDNQKKARVVKAQKTAPVK